MFPIRLFRTLVLLALPLGGLHGSPPNVVIVIADDMNYNDAGAYGNPAIQTPEIDQLARDGLRFDQTFLTTSSCSPSRASILTARYPHATGAPELHQQMGPEQVAFTEQLREAGYFTAAVGKWHLGEAMRDRFDLGADTGGGNSGTERWIEVLQERPRDRPFFLWLAAVDPHRGYGGEGGAPQVHDPDAVLVPRKLPDTPAVRVDLARYYDEITRLDSRLGEVRRELERQGVARSTYLFFLSDNGRPFPGAKTTLTDDGIRTPLIIARPGTIPAGSTSEALVSSIDLGPTVLELAGLTPMPTAQGQSFARLFEHPEQSFREAVFAEHNWHDYRAYERAVRTQRYGYIRNWLPNQSASPPADAVRSPTFLQMRALFEAGRLPPHQALPLLPEAPRETLFDYRIDPEGLNNLAGDPAYAAVLEELRQLLDDWRASAGDIPPASLTPDYFHRLHGTWLPEAREAFQKRRESGR